MGPTSNLSDQPAQTAPAPVVEARYRIESVDRSASAAEHRRHITGIETVDTDGTRRHWNDIAAVRAAMADGAEFYTRYSDGDRSSAVESYDCPCGVETIRSCLDPPAAHNLDNVAIRSVH